MKNFDGICALTQRPIIKNETIYFFLIERTRMWNTTIKNINLIYPGEIWKIVSLPIKAEYNGKGFVKNIDKNSKRNLKLFFDNNPIAKTISSLEKYFEKHTEGNIAYIMFHEDIINISQKYNLLNKEKALNIWNVFCELRNAKEKSLENLTLVQKLSIGKYFSNEIQNVLSSIECLEIKEFYQAMLSLFDDTIPSQILNQKIHIETMLEANFEDVYILGLISHLMSKTRKSIIPQIGFGLSSLSDKNEYSIIVDVLNNYIK